MKNARSAGGLGRRLSWWLALQTFVGLGLVCTAVYLVTAMTLSQRQDEALDQKQMVLVHLLAEGRTAHDLVGLKHLLDDFHAGHEDLALSLRASDGQEFYTASRPQAAMAQRKTRSFEVEAPQEVGGTARAELTLDTQADLVLLRRLALTLAAAALVGVLAVSVGGFWLVRLGLAPLRQLVEQTRCLSPGPLSKRLDGSEQPEELQPLIAQFNDLLDRLARTYQQMEGFNADVAHELNTPLAILISSCELALRKSRDANELRDVLGSNLEDLHRMAGIISDMLFLSNADRGAGVRRSAVSSLAALAGEVIEFHDAAMQEAGLTSEVLGDAQAWVDASLLRRAISNLLGNATRYATPGSAVLVQIERLPTDEVSIVILNRGATVEAAHLPRLFDRFYRADPSRAHGARNHGLGLSIVMAIARMHGGLAFASSADGVTRIGLTLAPDAAASDATGAAPT